MNYIYKTSIFPKGIKLQKLKLEINNILDLTVTNIKLELINEEENLYVTFDRSLNLSDKTKLYKVFKSHDPLNSDDNSTIENQTSEKEIITNSTINVPINTRTIINRDEDSVPTSGITVTEEDLVFNTVNGTTHVDGYQSIDIGNKPSNGPINIATSQNSRNIRIGNNVIGTAVFLRFYDAFFKSQSTETALSNINPINLQFTDVINHVIYGEPIEDTTLILFDAIELSFYSPDFQINDSIDFSIINTSINSKYEISPGHGGYIIGNITINSGTSGLFRMKITSFDLGSESYVVYRIS